jgi:hypothetical protein
VAAVKIPGPLCISRQQIDVDDGTMCRAEASGAGPVESGSDDVSSWGLSRKLLEAAARATPLLPAEMREAFSSLFTSENLVVTAGVLTVWAGSHFVGVGEVADVVLTVVGVAMLGTQAIQAAGDIGKFLAIASAARSVGDLDEAAAHLAQAIVVIGVTTFVALIFKYGGKASRSLVAGEDSFFGASLDAWLGKLGKSSAPPLQRQNLRTALKFFQEGFPGKSAEQIEGYVKGMDLSKSVRLTALPAGTEVIAYGDPRRLGMYYTKAGLPMDRLGIAEGARKFMRFRLTNSTTVLESNATGVADTWTTSSKQLAGGGGTQYVIPDASSNLQPINRP